MNSPALSADVPNKPAVPPDDSTVLSGAEEALLAGVVEVAQTVVRRHQLFLWARGALQSLVPHEILLCGYGDLRGRNYTVDKFAARPFPEEMYADLCDPGQGLLTLAHALWDVRGHAPVRVHGREARLTGPEQLTQVLQRHALCNCVFHGVPQINGSPSAFFCFVNLPEPLTRRTTYLIELTVPSLYAAHLKVLYGELNRDTRRSTRITRPAAAPRVLAAPKTITQRQVQILQWVQEGKSNREIAEVLKLSPLTVKNHVQNILKKLKVRNRAQAVGCAIGARLISSSPPARPIKSSPNGSSQ